MIKGYAHAQVWVLPPCELGTVTAIFKLPRRAARIVATAESNKGDLGE